MKVYQINSTACFSTGILAQHIHAELTNQGHQARFAYGNLGEPAEHLYHISTLWSQRLDAKMQQYTDIDGFFAKRNTKKLIEDISRFMPDIVHLHNLHGNYLDYDILFNYLRKAGLPVVVTLHDCWFLTGGCYHFTANGCEQWQDKCYQCMHLPSNLFKRFCSSAEQRLQAKKDWFAGIDEVTVVAVSEWLASVARRSHLSSRDVFAVYNGIDTSVFCPTPDPQLREKYGCAGKTVLLGSASSWNERKGLDAWIQLAAHLDDTFAVALVGLNKDQLPKNAPTNILALGRTTSPVEMAKFYNFADIFINMSFEETFGLTTAEAMACGKPVIVMNSTANPELITDRTGLAAEGRTPEQLLPLINSLLERGLDTFQAACVSRVKNNFSIDAMTAGYMQIYHDILQKNKTHQ